MGFIHLTTAHYLSIQVGARARWFGPVLRGYYVRVGWWISTDWPGLVMIMMLMMMTTVSLSAFPYHPLPIITSISGASITFGGAFLNPPERVPERLRAKNNGPNGE